MYSNSSPTETQLLASYERLIEISHQLNSTLDLGTLLRHIISAATELTKTEEASILLLDPTTGELRFESTTNSNTLEMEDIIVPKEGSIAGWVVTHGEPRVIQDVSHEPSFFSRVDDTLEFKTRNLLGVPMRAQNRVIGVLEAVNKKDGARFEEHDIQVLITLANQAAIAIENARLFQQSDFISEMVHELRTPLAALKASTTLLLRPDLPSEKREDIIYTMQGETERLIRLTSEFLDLARLESGRAKLDMASFDLLRLIKESVDVVLSQASDRGVTLEILCEPFTISGDRGKIKQVLLNLLTNAIKYNRQGGTITVDARVSPVHEEPFVELAVNDTGYGISKENQKNMFQKFYRVANTAGFTTGTGLGLAIAKHIIEAHGGHIWLESQEDVGSTFYLTLPLSQQS